MTAQRNCEACGQPGALHEFWVDAPLGLCFVRAHEECADDAVEARGGGRSRPAEDEQLERTGALGLQTDGRLWTETP